MKQQYISREDNCKGKSYESGNMFNPSNHRGKLRQQTLQYGDFELNP